MNLTPWDVQSKQIYTTDGIAPALWAGECRYRGAKSIYLSESMKTMTFRKTAHPMHSGGSGMGTDNNSRHAEHLRQQRGTDSDCRCFNHAGYGRYAESEIGECLRASGGDIGGVREYRPCPSWNKVGALCATDYKWVQQEQVEQGKIIPCRATR